MDAPPRKLAGILCEAALSGTAPYIIGGVGINISHEPGDWPESVRARAISLCQAAGRPISRPPLVAGLATAVLAIMSGIGSPLALPELSRLADRDALLGRRTSAAGVATVCGVAAGIAADGALRIREDSGRIVPVYQATVRPADGGEAFP